MRLLLLLFDWVLVNVGGVLGGFGSRFGLVMEVWLVGDDGAMADGYETGPVCSENEMDPKNIILDKGKRLG